MKQNIHPKYVKAKVTCSCGEVFFTRSTSPEIRIEICSKCHPFYTGKQKFIDAGGRVERFQKKFGNVLESQDSKVKSQQGKEGQELLGQKQAEKSGETEKKEEEKVEEQAEEEDKSSQKEEQTTEEQPIEDKQEEESKEEDSSEAKQENP